MADPLSIAASVAGLLALSGKVCSTLSGFVSSVVDAPSSAHAALAAVEEMRLALGPVKELIDTVSSLPSRRKVLVRVDHIAITISNCILTLSELESLICFKDGILQKLRWLRGENKVLRLLPRLESQKASLSLMVTVLQCQSETEALQGRERLNAAVDQILQQNEELAARLQRLEATYEIEDRSVRFFDGESIIESRRLPAMGAYGPEGPSSPSKVANLETSLSSRPDFETALEKSRVYMRTKSNESDMSFTSSAILSHAWSMLSLNDISVVAAFRLPITLDDINSFGHGLTFGTLLHFRNQDNLDALDPFAPKDARHLSRLSQGMASPFYDAATGTGIDRIESKDIIDLMQHLTVRDMQRSARDTEILSTLVRSAVEMRNRFENTKLLIADMNDVIITEFKDNSTVQRAIEGPRPYPGSTPRSIRGVEGSQVGMDELQAKKGNLLKRALKGLTQTGSNDLGRIEDMLIQLLSEADGLRSQTAGRGVGPQGPSCENLQPEVPYEYDCGYEPEGIAGTSTASHASQSGHFSITTSRGASTKAG